MVWLWLAAGLWAPLASVSESSFRVFLPDTKNQQLTSVNASESEGGIILELGPALSLGFAANEATAHPDGEHLIVGGSTKNGAVAATIELLADGSLRKTAESPVGEAGGYLNVDRTGRFFLSTHYRSALVATHALDDNAVVGAAVTSTRTPNLEAHCIVTTPDNRFVYVPCVKTNNAIFQYAFDEETGELSALEPFDAKPPAMFGPRHVVYHPRLPRAYFSNEQQLGVSVYEIADDGQLSALQHATSVPRRSPYEKGKRDLSASSIVLSPDATRLFVALRDFTGEEDSVFTFRVEEDGKLSLLSRSKVGDVPVRLLVSPTGSHLLISEMGDSRLSAYAVGETGELTRAVSVVLPGSSRDMVLVAD
ncbi:MAG: 6-phosphogluconolactonase [Synoicihabitans sp.]